MLSFSFDSMHIVLAVLGTIMFAFSTAVSPEYFRGQKNNGRFIAFSAATYLALMGVFLGADFLTVFVFFEIMSFTSWTWVIHTETKEALRAAETYLYVAVAGGLIMLMGLFLIYSAAGTLRFDELSAVQFAIPSGTKFAAGLCIALGFGAKAGMFPLQIWMPRSYPAAPTPATALLSSMLSKSGVFGIIAVTANLFPAGKESAWGDTLLILAVITMLMGAVLALFSKDLKRTLACSSMSQIGFILVGVAMYSILTEERGMAAAGATIHILNHSLIKQTLFVASGVIFLNLGTHSFDAIRGFGRGKPAFMIAFLAGACTVAGIPGFSGYISKTLLHEAIVEAGGYAWAEWLFLIAGGFTFAYMAKLVFLLLIAKPEKSTETGKPYCAWPTKVVIQLGTAAMVIGGLFPHAVMDRIAAVCAPFFRVDPMEEIRYFSLTNLKGSAISIGIGLVLFAIAFRGLPDLPRFLDMDNYFYRPLLKLLSLVGASFARLAEQAAALLVLGPMNLVFLKAPEKWTAPEEENFGTYRKMKKGPLAQQLFDSDLMFAGAGILAFIIFALVMIAR